MRRAISIPLLLACLAGCESKAPEAARDEEPAAAEKAKSAASASPMADARKESDDEAAAPSPGLMAPGRGRDAGPVRAGEWDDNANYREFMRYIAGEASLPIHAIDLRHRRFMVVRDMDGKAVPNCTVTVSDGAKEVTLVTAASGRAILFPHAEGLVDGSLEARAACGNAQAKKSFDLKASDGAVHLQLAEKRELPDAIDVEMAFILDTTGSMSEEISAVKATIDKVAEELSTREVHVRIALVEYKDRGDAFATKVYPFTSDLQTFRSSVAGIAASGGGDLPEDAIAGMHAGLHELAWSDSSVVRVAFMIGDAPPQLGYQSGTDYETELREASRRGIRIHTVAASGMDAIGQAVWRQIAQYTGGASMFVLRGGAGPQSTGGGDPRSSCGGTQEDFRSGNLDQLILAKVQGEIDAIDRNPMRIAGLGEDEDAKPCDQRVTYQQ